MVEYSLAKAKVEGSSPFFRLEGYLPGLSFNRDEMFVIIGGASRRRDKLLFVRLSYFVFLGFDSFPIPVSGIELKPRQKAHSAGQTEERKKTEKGGRKKKN
jgi:hypothetical protein